MTQAKIYGLRSSLATHRAALSDAINATLMATFGLPSEKRFQRFILLERDGFLFPADRSDNYTIL